MNLSNIDEINVFNNGDGSYSIEIHMSTTTNERATMIIPQAILDLSFSTGYGKDMTVELKLEGLVEKC